MLLLCRVTTPVMGRVIGTRHPSSIYITLKWAPPTRSAHTPSAMECKVSIRLHHERIFVSVHVFLLGLHEDFHITVLLHAGSFTFAHHDVHGLRLFYRQCATFSDYDVSRTGAQRASPPDLAIRNLLMAFIPWDWRFSAIQQPPAV